MGHHIFPTGKLKGKLKRELLYHTPGKLSCDCIVGGQSYESLLDQQLGSLMIKTGKIMPSKHLVSVHMIMSLGGDTKPVVSSPTPHDIQCTL